MSEYLFKDFDPVSAKQWKQKIQADLKGADYNDSLIYHSLEGIDVKPFYHQDDFKEKFSAIPGHPHNWNIAQDVFVDNPVVANKLALDAIERGVETIVFSSENEFDPQEVFKNFPFEKATIQFNLKFLSGSTKNGTASFVHLLISFFSDKKANVYYNIDIIGNLARTGNWFHNLKNDHSILDSVVKSHVSENIISVDVGLYQNAGATIVQQLAYALAHSYEYLNHFTNGNHTAVKMCFHLAVGSNYFFEIAKIRALRKLYALLANEFGVFETCHIVARPSKRNKTIYDYNVNMLRTTTECMSAVLGGADTICNLPYDSLYHKSNEFGERISRNQLLILKAESYFDTVCNPADGAYYIESLTLELTDKALVLFKDIESNGGFLSQLKAGTIQRKIKASAAKEQQLFDWGSLVILGTNKQINVKDKMKNELELFPFVKTNVRKTLISPIIENRLSEKTEQTRIKNE